MRWKSLIKGCSRGFAARAIAVSNKEFIKTWAVTASSSINALLQNLIPSTFKKYKKSLSEEGVLLIYRIICCHYLAMFIRNEDNIKYMERIGIAKDSLKIGIFEISEEKNFCFAKVANLNTKMLIPI